VLFSALDTTGDSLIAARDLRWLEAEVNRNRQKEAAKKQALKTQAKRAQNHQAGQMAIIDFKAHLQHQFGSLFRGWRCVLDTQGTMSVQQSDLFRACKQINWRGDCRGLWRALDHDTSGNATIEELDPHVARLLVQFQQWAKNLWGAMPSSRMFQSLDVQRRKRISHAQFTSSCEKFGFRQQVKLLASWLDWRDKKVLLEEDFAFLDRWKPPAWLCASPNYQAAEDFKKHLLMKYGHYLKAWRCAMDKDNSNTCNWHEFQEAAEKVRFYGDLPGAWLSLDEDLSGFISLREIDEEAHEVICQFKHWADDQFGGVRYAFQVMDRDKSKELDFREFRSGCRNFGFTGNVKLLFNCLDQNGEGVLQYKEIAFLDTWETVTETTLKVDELKDEKIEQQKMEPPISYHLLEYRTPPPGPGAYNVGTHFGSVTPLSRNRGSFSFACRRSGGRPRRSVGPANYSPSLQPTTQRKPAWSFGGSPNGPPSRPKTPPPTTQPRPQSSRSATKSPGPGAYDVGSTLQGPMFSMLPRRGLIIHPSHSTLGTTAEKYAW